MSKSMDVVAGLDEAQKLAFMKAFVHLARADGDFSKQEQRFILELAKAYGLKAKDKPEIFEKHTDAQIIKTVKTIRSRRAALELIKELCLLAHADDVLSDDEVQLIGKIGKAMKVELGKIEEISNWVIDRLIWLEREKIIFEQV